MDSQPEKISRVAFELAVIELLRLTISEAFFTPDGKEFRRKMEAFENAAVSGLSSRVPFPNESADTNTKVNEEACMLVTKIMTSIQHPDLASNDKP